MFLSSLMVSLSRLPDKLIYDISGLTNLLRTLAKMHIFEVGVTNEYFVDGWNQFDGLADNKQDRNRSYCYTKAAFLSRISYI